MPETNPNIIPVATPSAIENVMKNQHRSTPIRLLTEMKYWATPYIFEHIWGNTMGEHFYRKFTQERSLDVTVFMREMDVQYERSLWIFLLEQCAKSPDSKHTDIEVRFENLFEEPVEEPKETLKTFMVFYRRNHAGHETMFHSPTLMGLTHEFVCNVEARNAYEALLKMNPDTWDLTHDARSNNSTRQIHNHPEISVGDYLIEYTELGITFSYVVVDDPDNPVASLALHSLPPWDSQTK